MDIFIAEVRKSGDSLVITIPSKVVKFAGIKEGDFLKLSYTKYTAIKKGDVSAKRPKNVVKPDDRKYGARKPIKQS